MEEKICCCALNRIFGYKPLLGRALIETSGSAGNVFKAPDPGQEFLLQNHPERFAITGDAVEKAAEELENLGRKGIRFIPFYDKEYPELLKEIPDAPLGLYARGSLPSPERDCIAIVGTRDISQYGEEWCIRIIQALAGCKEKPAIISGMALGTDIIAHRTAIELGLPTIGVLPTGPDSIYPERHRDFGDRLCPLPECGLVTDYPQGTPPLPNNFRRRNRIIAGLSRAVIVIESRTRGGSLITADYAFQYDRDVFALPGRVDDSRSQGCNQLVHSNMAETIENMDGLLAGLALSKKGARQKVMEDIGERYRSIIGEEGTGQMAVLLQTMRQKRGLTAEELAEKTGIPFREVSELASLLENDGYICTDLLGRYMINAKKM